MEKAVPKWNTTGNRIDVFGWFRSNKELIVQYYTNYGTTTGNKKKSGSYIAASQIYVYVEWAEGIHVICDVAFEFKFRNWSIYLYFIHV